jgi:hypothetical protein
MGSKNIADGRLEVEQTREERRYTVEGSDAGAGYVDIVVEELTQDYSWSEAGRLPAVSIDMVEKLARGARMLAEWDIVAEHDDGP